VEVHAQGRGAVLHFTYHPSFRDNYHAALFSSWGNARRAARSVLVCAMFGLFLFVFLGATGYPVRVAVAAALLGAIGWAFVFSFAFSAWLAWSLLKRQRAIGPARITVTDEGLERSTTDATSRVAWERIVRVEETAHAFFLYDASRPVFAIEKSAVAPTEIATLREFLRTRKPGRYRNGAPSH
jgi:hypothetical protein